LLLVGHLARDLTPSGAVLGGTAAYAGMTAHAWGLRVGVVSAADPSIDLSPLAPLSLHLLPSLQSTTFENQYDGTRRRQILHALAKPIGLDDVPPAWRASPLIHLAPIAHEVDPRMVTSFPGAQVFLTPQGWLRRWDSAGVVRQEAWETILPLVDGAAAIVVSLEDLGGDLKAIEALARSCPIVAVTAGELGAYIASAGQTRLLPVPASIAVDSTGAGDVFAATFFASLAAGLDAWEAGRRANILAAHSILRPGLQGVPTPQECDALRVRAIV
jgi:hypothetical protein